MGRISSLIRDVARMIWRRNLWFLIPAVVVLLLATTALIVAESPALIPFLYALF